MACVGGKVADVGLATLDQLDRPVVQLVEVVGGVAHIAGPVEAQPLDITLDGVDVLLVFLGRVGIVETQVADAPEFLGQAEVDADRLGVTDVQVADWASGGKRVTMLLCLPESRSAWMIGRRKFAGTAGAPLAAALGALSAVGLLIGSLNARVRPG
ncbi:hypothetical protein PPS11_27281 [Pseudomonas putida S11]|nr:hypothetical protein PPS11_27281 [Pseudomonas putida S11]